MAANISPMEALGYRAAGKGGKAGRKGKIIRRLSWGEFTKDKKRTTVVILSLATSLSVYLCITTMLLIQAGNNDTDQFHKIYTSFSLFLMYSVRDGFKQFRKDLLNFS